TAQQPEPSADPLQSVVAALPADPTAPPTVPSPDVAGPGTTSPAPAAPRLVRVGPTGVTVLTEGSAPPEVMTDLGIDAISYDAVGEVLLSGRGQRDSELRIYLDNRPVLSLTVDASGAWSSPLPNVASGVYTLRVDALGPDGTVVSRVETPFQLTAPEIAARARQNGVTAITVQPGFTLWAISEGYFGDGIQYVQIFEANRSQIRDPDLIYPGQVFALPPDGSEPGASQN
ncbi:MAG: LysM peptidoglycan-binding domain-containing protein, partial [Jannaschia sp.]